MKAAELKGGAVNEPTARFIFAATSSSILSWWISGRISDIQRAFFGCTCFKETGSSLRRNQRVRLLDLGELLGKLVKIK